MAGIFERISTIVKSNVNELLDRYEDPAKMIDQAITDAQEEYFKARKESEPIIAHARALQGKIDSANKEAEKWHGIAAKALKAGNEEDAKAALAKEAQAKEEAAGLEVTYGQAKQSADILEKKIADYADGIKEMKAKATQVKAKAQTAKVRKQVADMDIGAGMGNASDLFRRMEEKADKSLAEAEARESMNDTLNADRNSSRELEKKYAGANSPATDDALAALKAEMGIA